MILFQIIHVEQKKIRFIHRTCIQHDISNYTVYMLLIVTMEKEEEKEGEKR